MAKAKKTAKVSEPKKPRKPREKKADAAPPEAKGSVPQDNVPKADPEMRELARHHRDKYAKLKEALSKAQRGMQSWGKEVKADGLTVRQIKLMHELSTPEGEQAWRMTIANDLIAAQYQGAAIGQQLTLFLEPDRTPAVDISYDEGVQDCMDGKAAKPSYDPSVPQYQSYLKGYGDETERRVRKGITKLEPKDETSRADTLAAARAANEESSPSADKLN
jgi:hypothetical protein